MSFNFNFSTQIPYYAPFYIGNPTAHTPQRILYSTLSNDIEDITTYYSDISISSINPNYMDNSYIIIIPSYKNNSQSFNQTRFNVKNDQKRLNSLSIYLTCNGGVIAYSYYIDISNVSEHDDNYLIFANLRGISTEFYYDIPSEQARNNKKYRLNNDDFGSNWTNQPPSSSNQVPYYTPKQPLDPVIYMTSDICANTIIDTLYTESSINDISFSKFFLNATHGEYNYIPPTHTVGASYETIFNNIFNFPPGTSKYGFQNRIFFNYNIDPNKPSADNVHTTNINKLVPGITSNPIQIDNSGAQIGGTINFNSSAFNKTCKIINGYNFETLTYDPNNIFGVQGLPAFDVAITKKNSENLTKNQLYNLYINRDIQKLSNITFGEAFSDLVSPPGRESLDCTSRDISNINSVINNNNFKWFTDLTYVANHYPNLLNHYGNANSGLKDNNKIILNKFLYKASMPNLPKNKKYAFLANRKTKNINRIIHPQLNVKNDTCNQLIFRF